MHILIYSYFAPRRDHLSGGVQNFLHYLLRGLIDEGENVSVLSPESDADDILQLGPQLSVYPILLEPIDRPLKPYERHYNLQCYSRLVKSADVVLSIDRSVPMDSDVPVVLSLNNFSYSTEVESVFSFRWDAIVVPSDYLRRCVEAIVGAEFWSNGQRPIHAIHIPIDTNYFIPVDSADLLKRLNLDKKRFKIIYPHRPDPKKGLDIALHALKYAINRNPRSLLLIPDAPDSVRLVRAREQKFVEDARHTVKDLGLEEHVVFHPWIGLQDMPAYFSLADRCLSLGTLPETFGLSVLQSISCLTPVIATPAGAIPEVLPPDHGVQIVDFNSPKSAFEAIFTEFDSKSIAKGRAWIEDRYNIMSCVRAYIDCLRSTKKSSAMYFPALSVISNTIPWLRRFDDGRVWHDYEMRYLTMQELALCRGSEMRDEENSLIKQGLQRGPIQY